MFHVKVVEDTCCVLFLVNHEKSMFSPFLDMATQEPFNVITISDSKFFFNFCGGNFGLCFGVKGDEQVVNTGYRDGERSG